MTNEAFGSGDAAFGSRLPAIHGVDELRDYIPYLLGFYPERSFIVVGLGDDRRMRVSARAAAPTDVKTVRRLIRHVGTVLTGARSTHALVVYADDVDRTEGEDSAVRATAFAAAVRHLADVRDLEPVILAELGRCGMTATFSWPEPDDLLRGRVVTPPPAALLAIAAGRTAVRSRDELVGMLRPAGGPARAETAQAVGDLDSVELDPTATTDAVLGVLQRHADARRDGRSAGALCPVEVAACAAAVSDLRVRDVVVSTLAIDSRLICDDVWLQVIRQAPDHLVPGAAVLLGAGAYLRGDGALAGCAFDRALEADDGYRLAILLRDSLASGVAPEAVRRLLAAAVADLADLLGCQPRRAGDLLTLLDEDVVGNRPLE